VTDPEGKRPLTLGEAASAQSFQLTEAGYYQIRSPMAARMKSASTPTLRNRTST
jgi:hypothetical protein